MKEEIQNNELLQSVLNASNLGLAVYKAIRNDQGQIIDIDFIHELSIVKHSMHWARILPAGCVQSVAQMV